MEGNLMLERSSKSLKALLGAPGFEPGTSCAQGKRATRLRHAPSAGPTPILPILPEGVQRENLLRGCAYFSWQVSDESADDNHGNNSGHQTSSDYLVVLCFSMRYNVPSASGPIPLTAFRLASIITRRWLVQGWKFADLARVTHDVLRENR